MENVLTKFHQIYRTCTEMMIDRGYDRDLLEKNYLNVSPDEFQKLYRKNRLTILTPRVKEKNEYGYVIILGNGVKLKKDVLKKILQSIEKMREIPELLTKESQIELTLVIDPVNTMTAIKLVKNHNIEDAKTTGVKIEVFFHNELRINITKHMDVPRHILLTKDEIEELKKVRDVTISQLARIITTDPVARYYAAKKGDVFKIIRPSLSAGQAIVYRLVV
jgi:DNA-directed RNA polymerase subunit H (RpoH/RPB5)